MKKYIYFQFENQVLGFHYCSHVVKDILIGVTEVRKLIFALRSNQLISLSDTSQKLIHFRDSQLFQFSIKRLKLMISNFHNFGD